MENTETQENETVEDAPQISLNDLATVVSIIDVVTKRGAFEGGELESVGVVRNRLAAFLKATMPDREEPEVDEESDSTETEAA